MNHNGPRAHVFIAIPNYRGEHTYRLTQALFDAQVYCIAKRIRCTLFIAARMTLIEYARAYLAAKFLESDATHLMCIDDDLGFDPTAIVRMVDRDKDIVGGVYPVKTIPTFYPYEPAGAPSDDGLQPVKSVPGGFVLIKRHVMEALAKTVPSFNIEHVNDRVCAPDLYSMTNDDKRDKIGEDIMFCRRAIAAGFQIWAETDVGFVHVGPFEWGGNLRHQLDREQVAAEAANQASAAPSLILPEHAGKVTPIAAAMRGRP
jgi:hypothetical protein